MFGKQCGLLLLLLVYSVHSMDDNRSSEMMQAPSLDMIAAQSEEGIKCNIDKRFKITDKHIEPLRPFKDEILKSRLYEKAQIITDITPPTTSETIKDKALCFLPHLLVTMVPDLVYNQTNDLFQGTAGLLATSVGSGIFGRYVYPSLFDSYNSDVSKLSKWFGSYNHTRINKGGEFFILSAVQYVATALAQKLWSWGTTPWRILSVQFHIGRLLSSLIFFNKHSKKHDDPFKRLNKDGVPFTLGDLVRGPKFTEKE